MREFPDPKTFTLDITMANNSPDYPLDRCVLYHNGTANWEYVKSVSEEHRDRLVLHDSEWKVGLAIAGFKPYDTKFFDEMNTILNELDGLFTEPKPVTLLSSPVWSQYGLVFEGITEGDVRIVRAYFEAHAPQYPCNVVMGLFNDASGWRDFLDAILESNIADHLVSDPGREHCGV